MQGKIARSLEIGVAGLLLLSSCSYMEEGKIPSLGVKFKEFSAIIETRGNVKATLTIPQCLIPSVDKTDIINIEMSQPEATLSSSLPGVLNLGSAAMNVIGAASGL